MSSTAPSIQDLLRLMVQKEASDLYLCAGAHAKLAAHGQFLNASENILKPEDTNDYALELMSEYDKAEFERELEVNLSYAIRGLSRFRVNVFTQRGSTGLVIRRITEEIATLAELGLPAKLGELVLHSRGMVLVTGATGSGKSTTLAAMINHRNERLGGHIITIEDPIEFVHRHKKSLVTQREVGIDTKSFRIALKNSLRQAPQVIYIGEIRDSETMEFAVHAAETGHLVLATLHSNNANQTLERILNFFPNEAHHQLLLQLSLNLRAIVSQRLIPRLGGGRVAALEIMINTPTIGELIAKNEVNQIKSVMAASANQGCQTFDMHIHSLWAQGLVSEDEAFRAADSVNNLRLRMKGIAVNT